MSQVGKLKVIPGNREEMDKTKYFFKKSNRLKKIFGKDEALKMSHLCNRAPYYVDGFFSPCDVMAVEASKWYKRQVHHWYS